VFDLHQNSLRGGFAFGLDRSIDVNRIPLTDHAAYSGDRLRRQGCHFQVSGDRFHRHYSHWDPRILKAGNEPLESFIYGA
jgi:hypothetical protein